MPAPTPRETLTADEAAALNDARRLGRAIAKRLTAEGYNTSDESRAFALGRVVELAEALDGAAFNLLNCASSYAGDRIADAAIKAELAEREREREQSQ